MMNPETLSWLAKRFGARVKFDEPMAGHTSFRVGGPADAFVTPGSEGELADLLAWLRERHIGFFILGLGTNILVRDTGIRGCVIDMRKCLNTITQTRLSRRVWELAAGAGAHLGKVCVHAISNGLAGLNSVLGIPGTVGGGIIMNAGTRQGSLGAVLDSVKVLDSGGKIRTLHRDALRFEYRKTCFPMDTSVTKISDAPPVVLEGRFLLETGDPRDLKAEARQLRDKRKGCQPLDRPNAGCVFRNPDDHTAAGALIDKAGLKGTRMGGARVSTRHANFIVNDNRATAADILALMDIVRETVSKVFGIELETEIQIVG